MKHNQTKLVLDGVRERAHSLMMFSVKRSGSSKQKPRFDLGAPFGMPGCKLKRGVISGVASSSIIVVIALLITLASPAQVLASTISQTNWSGGPGSSFQDNQYVAINNVVPSSSQVAIGTNSQDDWCNTASCDASWSMRREIHTYNSAENSSLTLHNTTQKLTITYESSMKADFSDLRFTDHAGTTDYAYYLNSVVSGSSAEVWVTIPTLSAGVGSYYMYYSNAQAVMTSSIDAIIHDKLSANDTAGFRTQEQCNTGYTIDNAAITLGPGCGLDFGDSLDNSATRVIEYDYKANLSSKQCGTGWSGANYLITAYADDSNKVVVGFNVVDDASCNTQLSYYLSNIYGPQGSNNRSFDSNSAPRFLSNTFYRFKQVNTRTSGTRFYYSTDNGITYNEVPMFSPNSSTTMDLSFHAQADYYPVSVRNVREYNDDSSESSFNIGMPEFHGGKIGFLSSSPIDMNGHIVPGALTISTTGSGIAGYSIRSSNDQSSLLGSISITDCNILSAGDNISNSTCVRRGDRYYQYQVYLSDAGSGDFAVSGVSMNYLIDNNAPTGVSNIVMRRGSGGRIIPNDGWFNPGRTPGYPFPPAPWPVISWDVASDGQGGSGIAGYCVYVGTDPNADITQTSGVIVTSSEVNTQGACQYATASTTIDLAELTKNASLDQSRHYIKIRALDNAGNLAAPTVDTTFRVDTTPPDIGSSPFYPNGVINTKNFTVSFGAQPQAIIDTGGNDGGSGLAGWKYCIGELNPNNGTADGCFDPAAHQYFGDGHTGSGIVDDIMSATAFNGNLLQGFTTVPADYPRIVSDGYNGVIFAILDQAGNFQVFNQGVVRTSTVAASSPQSLQATPTSAQENSFSFTWTPPQTYQGPIGDIDYCYTVNEPIASDAHNCRWTGKNITQLAAGPYATRQGSNTLYLMARDQTQNFSTDNVASVTFSATTIAPGSPQNLDISDVSVRVSSSWKLALSWAAPTQAGSGIATYKILRSINNSTFTDVGSTSLSNLSFIDAGLSQVTYYYQVQACDNAGNCSVPSNTVSRKPTGRFTSPANLVLAAEGKPVVTDISTRKVTIQWQTDRDSDSKIAIGTKSGQYAPDETGSSNQVTSHTVNITNLQPGTEYFYVAKWTDGDGNTGSSPEGSFKTAPAPSVSEVEAQRILVDSATISFRTLNTTSVKLNYGKTQSFGAVEKLNTSFESSDYSIPLTTLDDDTKYYYRFTLTDKDGNEYEGNINSFITTARPKITNVRREGIEGEPSSTQRFTWDTNTPTSSGLIYNAQGEQQLEVIDSKLTLTHSLVVTALKDSTNYSYVLRSRDAAGNTVTTDRAEFTTALDTRPPKISDVVVETAIRGTGTEARGQITVAWKTDEPSTSQVAFGQGQSGDYTGRTYEDATLTTEHVVVISDIPTSSVYHVQAVSRDAASNQANSDNQSVVLGRAADNIFTIIFEALSKIFGVSVGKQE